MKSSENRLKDLEEERDKYARQTEELAFKVTL